MKQITNVWLFVLLLTVLLSLPAGLTADTTIEFEGQYWTPGFDTFGINTGNGEGDGVDFNEDLGFGEKPYSEIRLLFTARPRKTFRLYATQLNRTGDSTLSDFVVFDERLFGPGTRVESEFDMDYLRMGYQWIVTPRRMDRFHIGLLFDVRIMTMNAYLSAPDLRSPMDGHEKLAVFLPTLGLNMKLTLHERVHTFVEIAGMKTDRFGSILDSEAGIRFTPVQHVNLVAGYRMMDVHVIDVPNHVEMKMSGPYMTLGFQF